VAETETAGGSDVEGGKGNLEATKERGDENRREEGEMCASAKLIEGCPTVTTLKDTVFTR
jgi:hypothetical protein